MTLGRTMHGRGGVQASPAPGAFLRLLEDPEEWRRLAGTGRLTGPVDARVRIVVLVDYGCPICATLNQQLDDLAALYPGELAVGYHFFPQARLFPHAKAIAAVAECGARQGRFGAVHNELFLRQSEIRDRWWEVLVSAAGDAEVDVEALAACANDGDAAAAVEAQRQMAAGSGIKGVPAVIVRGRVFYGTDGVIPLARMLADRQPRR